MVSATDLELLRIYRSTFLWEDPSESADRVLPGGDPICGGYSLLIIGLIATGGLFRWWHPWIYDGRIPAGLCLVRSYVTTHAETVEIHYCGLVY